ncbi:MAG: hypothetical protein KGL39_48065 [Patescibacteria group bacterium]|nr:hypothetical protein [Patescibacteria group bacterium]
MNAPIRIVKGPFCVMNGQHVMAEFAYKGYAGPFLAFGDCEDDVRLKLADALNRQQSLPGWEQ